MTKNIQPIAIIFKIICKFIHSSFVAIFLYRNTISSRQKQICYKFIRTTFTFMLTTTTLQNYTEVCGEVLRTLTYIHWRVSNILYHILCSIYASGFSVRCSSVSEVQNQISVGCGEDYNLL